MAEAKIDDGANRPKSRKRRRHHSHGRRTRTPIGRTDRKWLWFGAAIPVIAVTIGVGLAELNRAPPAPIIDTRPPAVSTPMVSCPGPQENVPPLVRAAACGDQNDVQAALDAGASPGETDSRLRFAGRTALHHAVQRRIPGMVEKLLAAGAATNAADAAGNTPLHLIVLARHHRNDDAIARQLLRAGADVQQRNDRHLTPLEELELDHSQLVYRQGFAHVLIGRIRDQSPSGYPPVDDDSAPESFATAASAYGDATTGERTPGPGQESSTESIETTRTALRLALAGWAEAWSKRDTAAYLAHYAEDFAPPDGISPDQWRETRRDELRQSEPVVLRLSKMEINIDGARARVGFTQDLERAGEHKIQRRSLVFDKRDGEWLIVSEQAGP